MPDARTSRALQVNLAAKDMTDKGLWEKLKAHLPDVDPEHVLAVNPTLQANAITLVLVRRDQTSMALVCLLPFS